MNRALRRRHLALVTTLAPVAAVILGAAITVRRAAPDSEVPPGLAEPAPGEGTEVRREIVRGEGLAVEARWVRLAGGAGGLDLHALRETTAADVLVYLARDGTSGLADARLLGSLTVPPPVRFTLPADADPATGRLLFYSPAVGRLLAESGEPPS